MRSIDVTHAIRAVFAGLVVAFPAFAQIQNGGFEPPDNLDHWGQAGGVTTSAPGSAGSGNSAQLGPSAGIDAGGGFRGSGIAQKFNCGSPTNHCFIRFDVKFPAALGSSAVVQVDGTAGLMRANLPVTAAFASYQIEYPACGEQTIWFMVKQSGASVTAECRIDNVQNKCDSFGYAVPGITLLPVSAGCMGSCAQFNQIGNGFGVLPGQGVYCTAGTTSNGCVPSISGVGHPSATAGSGFVVHVASVEGQKQGLLFYGVNGHTAAPWFGGTSTLCVRAPTQRMGAQNSGGTFNSCDGSLAIDWNAYIAANPGALGNPFSAGQAVHAQAWFRDPPAPGTTNLSDALHFDTGP